MTPVLVLNVVGLSPGLIGPATPHIASLVRRGGLRPLETITPAVTCSVQATFLTGTLPREHGVIANGWLFRELQEVWLWRQSNKLVRGEKVWDAARHLDESTTCANLFWWYAMGSSVDIVVTPRPIYKADGRKIEDCYSDPPELRDVLTEQLGPFPLFQFWGPATSIASTRWIAKAAIHVMAGRNPSLTLVYLPHMDYALQRLGPNDPQIQSHLSELDCVVGELIQFAQSTGRRIILLSEYGVVKVDRPVHINRCLREAGFLSVRCEQHSEHLDIYRSRAFAVSDHQIAHIYVREAQDVPRVAECVRRLDGVEDVLDCEGKARLGLDHPRSGELVALAAKDAWFTYYYWLDDCRAPDFARTVDIHRKPGYDPTELFIDPTIALPQIAIGWRLLKKKLGFRSLMDIIPLDASLIRGSHGRADLEPEQGPVIISSEASLLPDRQVRAENVKAIILDHLFSPTPYREAPSNVINRPLETKLQSRGSSRPA